jgi:hypothetical protein
MVQESNHTETDEPLPGTTRVMERYRGISDSKWRHERVIPRDGHTGSYGAPSVSKGCRVQGVSRTDTRGHSYHDVTN